MRILIASVEAEYCQEIRTLLESAEGIVAIEQQAGPPIMDQIQAFQPDLILLDLDAGTSYPLNLVSTISRRHPNIKILVLSGLGQEDLVLGALRNGADGHLAKDSRSRDEFIAALQAVRRGDSILSPAIAGVILDEISYQYHLSRRTRAAAAPQPHSWDSTPAREMTE